MWKKDNMWSPRRGLGAAVANGKVFVVGGQAREYARIDDSRLFGGLAGQNRIETVKDHSTIPFFDPVAFSRRVCIEGKLAKRREERNLKRKPWQIVIGGWGGNDDDYQQRCPRRQAPAVG
jgi:hypothetical protein